MREEPYSEFLRNPNLVLKSKDEEIVAEDFIELARMRTSIDPLHRPENMNEVSLHLAHLC